MHPAAAIGRTADTHSLRAARQLYGGDPASDQRPAGSVANTIPCYYQQQAGANQPRAIKNRRRRPRSKSKICRNQDDAKHYACGGAGNQAVPKTEPRLADLQVTDDEVRTRPNDHVSNVKLAKNDCSARDAGASIARTLTPRTSECTAGVGPVCGSSRRKTRTGRGKKFEKFPRSGQQVPKKMVSTLSQRELNMQMRLLSPGEQGIIDHVLETFAAQVDGKSMRTRDFFNMVSSELLSAYFEARGVLYLFVLKRAVSVGGRL